MTNTPEDLVERLQAIECGNWVANWQTVQDLCGQAAAALLAFKEENGRYRTALEEIGGPDPSPKRVKTYRGGFDQAAAWASRIARQALQQEKQG